MMLRLARPGHEDDELYRALLQLSLQGLDPWHQGH